MTGLLTITMMISLAAAFVVLLVKKWGIAEWMQIHGDSFTSKLFGCDLCMSFWTCFVVTLAVACLTEDNTIVLAPVFATPLTRMLV